MSAQIHPTALIDPRAVIGDGVVVGPYCVIEGDVTIGDGCLIGPYCRFTGHTTIGRGNRFESHCSVGAPPQDLKYAGQPTRLVVGDDNVFREFVTLHRGTPGGGGVTTLGNGSLLMTGAHVAHDSHVGNRTIFANAATLAGHVEVGDDASIGAFSAVHQFCRVGAHAFLGGFTVATKDCLPFMKTVGGRPARCYGPNTIGLERKGISAEARGALKRLWRHLHNPKLPTSEALEISRRELAGVAEVEQVLAFIDSSHRGVILSLG